MWTDGAITMATTTGLLPRHGTTRTQTEARGTKRCGTERAWTMNNLTERPWMVKDLTMNNLMESGPMKTGTRVRRRVRAQHKTRAYPR